MSRGRENSNWDLLFKKKLIKLLFFHHASDTGKCLEILGMSMLG